jgi:hypothetical protein
VEWLNKWDFNWYNLWPTGGFGRIKGIYNEVEEFNVQYAIPSNQVHDPCNFQSGRDIKVVQVSKWGLN